MYSHHCRTRSSNSGSSIKLWHLHFLGPRLQYLPPLSSPPEPSSSSLPPGPEPLRLERSTTLIFSKSAASRLIVSGEDSALLATSTSFITANTRLCDISICA